MRIRGVVVVVPMLYPGSSTYARERARRNAPLKQRLSVEMFFKTSVSPPAGRSDGSCHTPARRRLQARTGRLTDGGLFDPVMELRAPRSSMPA